MSLIHEIVRLTQRKAVHADALCERLGIDGRKLASTVAQGQREGYVIRWVGGMLSSRAPSIGDGPPLAKPIGRGTPGRKHVALITDLHFGSKHTDLAGLQKFLGLCKSRGVRTVVCTGDVLDGCKPVLIHEQTAVGFDDQAELAVKAFSGSLMRFVAIDGNHDGYHSSNAGMISGRILEQRMKEGGVDWTFAGVCLGRARIEGAHWQLWHPHGGASTRNAIRRILNARIEAMEEHCDILAMGHYHKFATVAAYPEGVFGVAGGTFQLKRSEFANRIGNGWDVGGAIVSYTVDRDKRVSEVSAEFFPSSQ